MRAPEIPACFRVGGAAQPQSPQVTAHWFLSMYRNPERTPHRSADLRADGVGSRKRYTLASRTRAFAPVICFGISLSEVSFR